MIGSAIRASAPRENGFALLLVLIALATLSLVVAAVVDSARHYGHDSVARADMVRLGAALDGAVATAARDLVEASAATPLILQHPQTIVVDGISVTVSARPETAKIDLNAAPVTLLASLLRASGLKMEAAGRLADEIADWRDADAELHPHGAEVSQYLLSGRGYGPANRPLRSVSELALLLDGSQDLVACLVSDVTIFTASPDVDPVTASARVRRAASLPGMPSQGGLVSIVGGRIISSGALFEIEASATGRGERLTRRTVLRITGDPRRPFWILSQLSPAPRMADQQAACKRLQRSGAV